VILVALTRLERIIESLHQIKTYEIQFRAAEYSIEELESELNDLKIRFVRIKTGKENSTVKVEYNIVFSPKKNRDRIDHFFINNNKITGFDV
jgi:uncharacterized membrane protein YhiD involved in acid resistance